MVNVKSFYIRRVLRIWPLYFAVLFIGFGASHVVPDADAISVQALLAYVFWLGNWYAAFHGSLGLGIGVIWSVNVEEQFYLLLPLAARAWTRRGLLILCATVWAVSQLAVAIMCAYKLSPWMLAVVTITNMQYFAIGAAISRLLNGRVPSFNPLLRIALVTSGLGLFAFLHPGGEAHYLPYLSSGVGSALIF